MEDVESCRFPVEQFDHRAHLRLAYVYLVKSKQVDESIAHMRDALTGLLRHAGVDPSVKYHETLTQAWIRAVNHFMNITQEAKSADQFIDKNPLMLDSKIMLSHYSAETLFSDEARHSFVKPNLEPIPQHENLNQANQ